MLRQKRSSFPGYDGVLGTLRACRDQTSQFCWDLKFAAVERMLHVTTQPDHRSSSRKLPFVVLQGFLDFLFAVQSLPDDRYIHIVANEGYATVVVWAHHVLGLNVVVQAGKMVIRFGQGREHVLFERVTSQSLVELTPTICLLNANAEDDADIFRLSTVRLPTYIPLSDDIRAPAYGYGRVCLEAEFGNQRSVVRELAQNVVAYAWNAFLGFVRRDPAHSGHLWREHDRTEDPAWTRNRILEAGRFLSAGLSLDAENFNSLVQDPEGDLWTAEDGTPIGTLEDWLELLYGRSLDSLVSLKNLSKVIGSLSAIVVAFAMVPDLESRRDLSLRQYSSHF